MKIDDFDAQWNQKSTRGSSVGEHAPHWLLRRFILDVGLSLKQAALYMEVPSSVVLQWWSKNLGNEALLGKRELSNLCKKLSICESSLMEGSYDRALVRCRIHEDPTALPDDYSIEAYSHVRSSAHMIRYLVLTRGQAFCDRILSSLNISPLIYEDLNRTINLKYFIDILNALSRAGLNDLEMKALPSLLFLSLMETPMGHEFKASTSYYDCYLTLAKNIHLFDENFMYDSDVHHNSYRLVADLPCDLFRMQGLELEDLGPLLAYRERLPGWFAYLSGLAPLTPKVTYEVRADTLRAIYNLSFPAHR